MDIIKHEKNENWHSFDGPWVLHPTSFGDHEAQGKTNYLLAEVNQGAAYEYEDYALVWCKELQKFYLLYTSGCSCPDPSETGVELAGAQCTSWRELQQLLAASLGWSPFAEMVKEIEYQKDEIDRICFSGGRAYCQTYRW